MGEQELRGWKKLLDGYPSFDEKGSHPIRAYSEFMPSVRIGRRPYGGARPSPFVEDDDFGWPVTEVEEEYELKPGLASIAQQVLGQIIELGEGKPAYRIAGRQRRNLNGNPYWPAELAEHAGRLSHEKYVVLLPLALSRTQDDRGRTRWTLFGAGEQGPEQAIWESFYSSPGHERPSSESLSFLIKVLSTVYGEACQNPADLLSRGLRIWPSPPNSEFPYWCPSRLPASARPFLLAKDANLDEIRYVLTFAPFGLLPEPLRARYISGRLVILPFPGSLVFWGMPSYIRLQRQFTMAMQPPVQRLVARHGGPEGIKVPQSGWFHEPGSTAKLPDVDESLLLNTYRRTSRWDRTERHDDEVILSNIEDTVARTLFSTDLNVMGLYSKPMARNSQIWTADSQVVLDGPEATKESIERAAATVARGGSFRYRFQFPAMRVGNFEVYWQRPMLAYLGADGNATLLEGGPEGYLTAYRTSSPDLGAAIRLWPRMQRRPEYLTALRCFEHLQEHYRHQTALNIVRLLDVSGTWGRKLVPRSVARQVLRIPADESLEAWLAALPGRAGDLPKGRALAEQLERRLLPGTTANEHTSVPGIPKPPRLPRSLTYAHTAQRNFEEAWWRDIVALSRGEYVNKNNGDCVQDAATEARLTHRHRDLEALGRYLLKRHNQAIVDLGMTGEAACGELRFRWDTDFDFKGLGGWEDNQDARTYERDVVVVIPGQNQKEAVIMADHYDTAFMEDAYYGAKGGTGARIASAGADDNCSATATLLQASRVFLRMSRQGLLKRDIWLVHLTGEEFPADCMGARALCQALIERHLRIYLGEDRRMDLSSARVVGAYVLDMIAHNRDSDKDIFQIAPGQERQSLRLAHYAHLANVAWNVGTRSWNSTPERRGKGRGRRSVDGEMPSTAEHPRLKGEIRLIEDPHSSLYNTDAQIFSDCGVPVVLLMEDYDIHRAGYHDTRDTITDIDLDYGAGLAAVAIEAVARAATG
jgi:hypothetical protein